MYAKLFEVLETQQGTRFTILWTSWNIVREETQSMKQTQYLTLAVREDLPGREGEVLAPGSKICGQHCPNCCGLLGVCGRK